MDYLRVFDSYLGGLGAYDYVSQSRDCVSLTEDHLPNLNETYKAWTFANESYNIYMEETPTVIYNASETISQEIAPIYRYCASSIYIGYDMFATKQEQFSTFNYWVLSALQNFLSKVFSLNKYYQYYLEVVAINDVDV